MASSIASVEPRTVELHSGRRVIERGDFKFWQEADLKILWHAEIRRAYFP